MATVKNKMRFWRRRIRSEGRSVVEGCLRRCGAFLTLGFLLNLHGMMYAQDLVNTGAINNSGMMRVKRAATGLPDSIDGRFEYFGGDQVLAAKQYKYLLLSGSGRKTTLPGTVTVTADISIAGGVTLAIDSTSHMVLKGNLSEQGYLTGSIQRTVDLSGSAVFSDFGHIGGTISWLNTAPGVTTMMRTSGVVSSGNGYQSIRRHYDIVPSRNSGLNAKFIFGYDDRELNGQDKLKLLLWKSVDTGRTWKLKPAAVDTAARTVTGSGMTSLLGRWTLSDSAHPLGPLTRVATNLYAVSALAETSSVHTALRPFVVTVTDIDGKPVEGETVVFAIDSLPGGSSGAALSNLTAVTDTAGRASTTFTLGTKTGVYIVSASEDGLTGSPVRFTVRAKPGSPALFAQSSGSGQRGMVTTILANPFIVTVTDSFGNVVPGRPVSFGITGKPSGTTGDSLISSSSSTDSLGQASALLKLGNRIGAYIVTASSGGLANSPLMFTATAFGGTAATMQLASGNNQSKSILDTLDRPFVVIVNDVGGNPVRGVRVNFAITAVPAGAARYALDSTAATTDSLGEASAILKLGNREGAYVVSASTPALAGVLATFNAAATVLMADVNNDTRVNIADLTTVFDAVQRAIRITEADSVRADVNTDNLIDAGDETLILNGLLSGKWDSISTAPAPPAGIQTHAEFEVTKNGLRFNLTNDVRLKGVQIIMRLKNPVAVVKPDIIYSRAKMMQIPMTDSLGLIRIVLYNTANDPVGTGSGSLFRLPLVVSDTGDLDVREVIVSTVDNRGFQIPVVKSKVSGRYPDSYALDQNYPNPFNNTTHFWIAVPDVPAGEASVLLQVFDLTGQRIATLTHGSYEPGRYLMSWNGTNDKGLQVASGVYLVRLWAPETSIVRKVMLMK